jgi:hypothetical protein
VAALVRQGVDVHAFNQRTVAEIFDIIRMLGAMVGRQIVLIVLPTSSPPGLPGRANERRT